MAKKQYGLGHTRLTVPGRPDLTNKTAVVMVGDKTLEEALEGAGTLDYEDLDNLPSINGVELNGNKTSSDLGVATSQQGAKADTAYQKPSTGIPQSDLSSDVQSQLNKHFKGWYASSNVLPANPVVGDYAYVKGAESTDPAAIYECTTAGSWSDSGRTFNPENIPEYDDVLSKSSTNAVQNQTIRNYFLEDVITSKNLLSYDNVTDKKYIANVTTISSSNTSSYVTVPVKDECMYYLYRDVTGTFEQAIRGIDAEGNGVGLKTSRKSNPQNASRPWGNGNSGSFYVPKGVVAIQFNIKYVSHEINRETSYLVEGLAPSQFTEVTTATKLREALLPELASQSKKLEVILCADGDIGYILGNLDEDTQIKLFIGDKYAPRYIPFKTFEAYTIKNGTTKQIDSSADDIAVVDIGGVSIGANHAYSMKSIKCTGHDKTFADIGSKWSDGTHDWYIINIIDANNIAVMSDYDFPTYPLYAEQPSISGSTLTHVSGATNTGNISFTANSEWNMYTYAKLVDKTFVVDGEVTTRRDLFYCDEFSVRETYDLFNPASILNKIKQAVGTFTANPDIVALEPDVMIRFINSYTWNDARTNVISSTRVLMQDVTSLIVRMTQKSELLTNSVAQIYIPRIAPIEIGGNTYDFKSFNAINILAGASPVGSKITEDKRLSIDKPCNRFIELTENAGIECGIIEDIGDASNLANLCSNTLQINPSSKSYLNVVDSKNGNNNAYQAFSFKAFRSYLPNTTATTNNIITNIVEHDNAIDVYCDIWQSGAYDVEIPEEYVEKEITILDKTSSISVLGAISSKYIKVRCEGDYGYVIIRIK